MQGSVLLTWRSTNRAKIDKRLGGVNAYVRNSQHSHLMAIALNA